jgi:hypothetical protein
MAATTNNRRELAHRSNDGIDVHLYWTKGSGCVTVSVLDERIDERFELEVEGRLALDAFNHPYAYASADAQS